MRSAFVLRCALIGVLLVMATCASAWDHYYDGGVLPNDPSLGADAWTAAGDLSMCSSDGSVLLISDARVDSAVSFHQSSPPVGSPLTVQARVRVVSGSSTVLYAGTPSRAIEISLYPNRLVVGSILPATVTFNSDLTSFRTIRVAMAGASGSYASYVWLDGVLVAQGTAWSGNYQYVMFGSPWGGTGVSYWDYVGYSNAFPEPSSLSALCTALCGFGAMLRRARRA